MPAADEMPDELDPLKLMLVANSKAGKTDYLLRAAEFGFNVLFIDGDIGARTMRAMLKSGRLSPAAAKRIMYMSVADYINDRGQYVSFMADFFVQFSTAGKFMWNDSLQRPFKSGEYDREAGHVVWEMYPSRMKTDTLLIVDSYTALVTSVLNWKADSLGEDLGDIEKISRDMYAGSGHKLTHFMQLLKATKCHLGLICHAREYVILEKPKGKIGSINEKDMKIKDTMMVPVSSSNPHALTLAKNFTDVGWIDVSPMGKRVIDFQPSGDRVIGGQLTVKGDVDENNFLKLIKLSGGSAPVNATPDSWLRRYGPGEYELPGKAAALGSNPSSQGQAIPATTGPRLLIGKK